MDIKDLLPFLVVIIISIVGSLTKKKKQNANGPQSKNVFEKMLDELNGNNTTEVHEGTREIQMDDELLTEQQEFYEEMEEEVVPVIQNKKDAKITSTKKPISLLEAFQKKQEEREQRKGKNPLKVIDLEESSHALELNLNDPDEVRKAIVYSEILKPRYF